MNRKICIVTGSRSEYGLLRWIMQDLFNDPAITLQIIVTGTHLSPEFDLTYKEIERDGFEIARKVEILLSSDTGVGVAKSMGLGLIGFADALNELKPDLLVVLGDRYEIFSAVTTALVLRVPVDHLHGGERTYGSFDDAIRHSITKMSHLHFVATEEYAKRVHQLGENIDHIFVVGGLAMSGVKRLKLLDRVELEESLGIVFDKKSLLVTFHPASLGLGDARQEMGELLDALAELKETTLIFTLPNADTQGRELKEMVEQFVIRRNNAYAFSTLGQLRYLSCIAQVDGVVGNSSSGLIEAPSFHKGTINIGDRQQGRLQADSIINCEPVKLQILAALESLYSKEFQSILVNSINPYDKGDASEKTINIIKNFYLTNITKKTFHDL